MSTEQTNSEFKVSNFSISDLDFCASRLYDVILLLADLCNKGDLPYSLYSELNSKIGNVFHRLLEFRD